MAQERARPGVRLTTRGAVALIFVVTLAARVTGATPVIGLAFCAACLAGVLLVQQRDLLSLVVTPPLTFFAASLVGTVAGALGAPSPLQAFGLGMIAGLSAAAPWLFGGSALVLAVAWFRGLPGNVSELRAELRAARAARSGPPVSPAKPAGGHPAPAAERPGTDGPVTAAGRPAPAAERPVSAMERPVRAAGRARPGVGQVYAPEPEGYFEPRVYGTPREAEED
ncbi:DUF6542 domain-containing protein [Sphaerisporangium melleum]